ncbi:MAG: 3-hydroxyacyl-CoA dehydrogenase NAD-binding domain-containing protein, partial [Gammaproteobacteria bacterium]
MDIHRIGVIGAGQMGNGIAHVCALAGYDVLLHDVKTEKIEAAFELIAMNLSRQVARGKISDADKDRAMKRLVAAPSLDAFSSVDLAIEAATEDEKIKR